MQNFSKNLKIDMHGCLSSNRTELDVLKRLLVDLDPAMSALANKNASQARTRSLRFT